MTNVFQVSHIFPTRPKAPGIIANYEKRENVGHIVRDKCPITSLPLTREIYYYILFTLTSD